jgi:hypothetical protein
VAAGEAAVDAEDEQDDDEQADAGRDEAADEELLWVGGRAERRGRRTARPCAGRARLVIVEEGQIRSLASAGGSV